MTVITPYKNKINILNKSTTKVVDFFMYITTKRVINFYLFDEEKKSVGSKVRKRRGKDIGSNIRNCRNESLKIYLCFQFLVNSILFNNENN